VLRAQHRQAVGLDAVLHRPHEQVAQLGPKAALVEGEEDVLGPRRPGRVTLSVAGQQLTEDDVLLGTADQARRFVTPKRGLPPQDPESERLVRASQRLGRCAGQPCGDPLAQPGRRHARRGEQQALVGGQSTDEHPVDDQLDGGRRLARARGAEDPDQWRSRLEHRLLLVVESGSVDDECWGSSQGDHVVIPPRAGDNVRQLAGPCQRALARSTRRPSRVPRTIGVFSSR
jgi:hypothetical protein